LCTLRIPIKKILLKEYVGPFLERIKEKFDKKGHLILTIGAFQSHANQILDFQRHPQSSKEPSNQINIGKDMFGESLSSDTKLKKAYQDLATIYCYKAMQASKFPEYRSAQIQTCIRELIHDALNPVEKLTIQNIQIPKAEGYRSTPILNLPYELAEKVHSFLDYQGCKSFSSTSKDAYFLHTNVINRPGNIFYALGQFVEVCKVQDLFEMLEIGSLFPFPENKSNAIMSSAPNKHFEMIKLFPSLYQAIEYAHYLSPISGKKMEEVHQIPSIWAVHYQRNVVNLKYISKDLILNNGYLRKYERYVYAERNLAISYANVETESIRPLVGAVLHTSEWFADYRVLNTVNYQVDYQADAENKNEKNDFCCIS
jgi:hypothetical protein